MALKENPTIRLLIADDHPMVRYGIQEMLSASHAPLRFEIDEAETSEEAFSKAIAHSYDVILMDFNLPGRGGDKATEFILQKRPGIRVLALSNYDQPSYVERMIRAGARGYILKSIDPDTLVTAIKTVLSGKEFYSNEIALQLMARPASKTEEDIKKLTSREREIFSLIIEGMMDREIAHFLGIAKRTVDKHRQNLIRKLGARTPVELVQAAVKLGMMG